MTENNVTEFDFKDHKVRTVMIDGEPWFVTKDVFDTLEYPNGSRTYQLKQLGPDETTVLEIKSRQNKLLSESGLFKLVMRSDKPEAKAFQDWVTREVLPSIRKNGFYISDSLREANPEAVQEFEGRVSQAITQDRVWLSLNDFLEHKKIMLPQREYWMTVEAV